MSASDKKKFRKEQSAAAMTERQLEEKKKQKKQKSYTVVFAIAMILVIGIVLFSIVSTPITNAMINSTIAAKVADHELTATELNYYFVDVMNSKYNEYKDYGEYQDMYVYYMTGWNPAQSLDSQTYDQEAGTTYADHFIDEAVKQAKWSYALYDAAIADGFELSEDDQNSIDSMDSYYDLMATYVGFSSGEAYLRAMYGSSATMETYKEYSTIIQTAKQYANKYIDSLKFTDEDFRQHEEDKMAEYNSYSWLSYYVNASNYLTGGTTVTDEDGNEVKEYTDAEKKAAVEAAKTNADALLAADFKDLDSMNAAIAKLENVPEESEGEEYSAQLYDKVTYYSGNEEATEWLISTDRAAGDKTVIAYTTKDDDGNETTNGYYVLYYISSTDNKVNIGTVRHLLVAFAEDEDGQVSDEAKQAAKKEAEDLLAEFEAGEKTEEAFTELLKEHSDDRDDSDNVNNDGLYSDITPDSSYVQAFKDWATAEHKKGDVEIVETEYGYHIMYYVSSADLNYRDTMINNDLVNDAYTAWEEDILKDVTSEELETKYIDRDYVMSSGS